MAENRNDLGGQNSFLSSNNNQIEANDVAIIKSRTKDVNVIDKKVVKI